MAHKTAAAAAAAEVIAAATRQAVAARNVKTQPPAEDTPIPEKPISPFLFLSKTCKSIAIPQYLSHTSYITLIVRSARVL